MESIKKFNGLNGSTVSREELLQLLYLANLEEQKHLSRKIKNVLLQNSDSEFTLEISDNTIEALPQSILNGLQLDEINELEHGLGKAVSTEEIYKMVTDIIIEALEKPLSKDWEMEWGSDTEGYSIAYNFVSKKPYRSVNQIILNPRLLSPKYEILKNPYFLTFKQVSDLGGKVKKDSKGQVVTYYSFLYSCVFSDIKVDFKTYDREKFIAFVKSNRILERLGLSLSIGQFVNQSAIAFLKYYKVFNGSDVEGIDFDLENFSLPGKIAKIENHHEKIDICEAIVSNYPKPKPKFTFGGTSAHFDPQNDVINMPNLEQFKYVQAYYTTYFHEMIHSTGVQSRLDRDLSGKMRTKSKDLYSKYAFEELIAELGAIFLCSQSGILHYTLKNSLAYVKGWRDNLIAILKDDNKFVFRAATQSQKAVDFLLENFEFEVKPKDQEKAKENEKKPVVKKEKPRKSKVEPKSNGQKMANVFNLPVSKIIVDAKRFQNRMKLNETVLNSIIKNYSQTQLDPVIVWIEDNKTYLLAGHHRLEATKRLGVKTIPAKYFEGNEAEAIHFAKVESNANRSMETESERANIYREMRKKGVSKKEISQKAKEIEGKNANGIINLSYLNPSGIVLQSVDSLSGSDKQNKLQVEKIADWIGEARKTNEILTNSHEKEMFDFLQDKSTSERIKTKTEFLQKIQSIVGVFDFEPAGILNLKRFKYKSEGEKEYDNEFAEIKSKIDTIINNRVDLKERLTNPNHADYIKPDSKDYNLVNNELDAQIKKYSEELKFWQTKLLQLQQKKGKYTNAGSNQSALFGAKKGLNSPFVEDVTAVQPEPIVLEEEIQDPVKIETTVLAKVGNLPPKKYKTALDRLAENNSPKQLYDIKGDLAKFLGKIEIKPQQSLVITLDSGEGGGKTHTLYNWANEFFEAGYKTIIWSLEEHATSGLATDKAEQYFGANKAYIPVESENDNESKDVTVKRLFESINDFDVIMIDSWAKVMELDKMINIDQDLRKKFNGKLIVVVLQRTVSGEIRGGSKAGFDGDIILKVEVDRDDFRNNYIYNHKNRYNDYMPISDLKYSPYHRKLLKTDREKATESPKLSFKAIEIN